MCIRDRYKGLGGIAQRATIINEIREKEKNVLLLDAGDIFQGTPYFNYYGGELEFKLMSKMNYDAATLGNHDFDNGIDGLERQLKHATFPFLIANYDFKGTLLENRFKPYKIFNKDGIKVGVFGIGVELEGLVPKELYKEEAFIRQYNHHVNIIVFIINFKCIAFLYLKKINCPCIYFLKRYMIFLPI